MVTLLSSLLNGVKMDKNTPSVVSSKNAPTVLSEPEPKKNEDPVFPVTAACNVIDPSTNRMVSHGTVIYVNEETAKRLFLNGEILKPSWI